jgi:toxin ParE1/3/4
VARYFLSQEAIEDLDLIWTHIAQDNPEAADRVLDAAYRTCQMLAQHPELGRLREFPNTDLKSMRSFVVADFPNYVVFYRTLPDKVEIVRVLHGARDIDSLFDSSRKR